MIPAVTTFKAIYVTQEDGKSVVALRDLDRDALPAGEVLVRVACSGLNYKDGLAVTGKPGVIRKYPMVPGIDFAGVVEESSSAEFRPGDAVVVTGCGTSETMWGGYAQLARLDARHIVPLPAGMTLQQSMGIGTAGFTAMQSLLALERHGLAPDDREVLVTGAAGGVGSCAVAILAQLGYRVAASTGRVETHDYLRGLGAATILSREEAAATSKRPLVSERWAAASDSVGGDTLAATLRSVAARGSVAACGLAGGAGLNTTVLPFILRGVNLLGIDSSKCSKEERVAIWKRLPTNLPLDKLDAMMQIVPMSGVIKEGARILEGKIRGRTVVDVNV
jgi:acrylyl-CoA reductase (NADPH)